MIRSPALLRLARDQSCTNCGADDGTIVAAHSNWMRHGKGKSIKAHDIFHAHLCFRCHGFLDQGGQKMDPTQTYRDRPEDKMEMFQRAMERTWIRLWEQGKLKVGA
jgi:hypothetical protein